MGILKYAYDTDGKAVESPDLTEERDRLERARGNLSRNTNASNNYRDQQRTVARRHADLKRKRRDLLQKLSVYYAREYKLVAEDLNAIGLVELTGNSRNLAGSAWGTFLFLLGIQVRTRSYALRGGRTSGDDEGVCGVRCLDRQANIGP